MNEVEQARPYHVAPYVLAALPHFVLTMLDEALFAGARIAERHLKDFEMEDPWWPVLRAPMGARHEPRHLSPRFTECRKAVGFTDRVTFHSHIQHQCTAKFHEGKSLACRYVL